MENLVIKLSSNDHSAIIDLWENSVKASHHFLKPEEIDFYKPFVLKYALPTCNLYGIFTNKHELGAFIGLSVDKIEMLFVHPDHFKKGYGRCLINFAEKTKKIKKVDVNEENTQALNFYLHLGFKVINRSELDGNGKPHPLLFLQKD